MSAYSSVDFCDKKSNYITDTLKQYISDISNIDVLDDDTFKKLYFEYKNGSVEAGKKIIESNLRLVKKVASKYSNSEVSFLDLLCEGNLGLFEALERYDMSKARYSTYAYKWVDRAIRRGIMNSSRNVSIKFGTYESLIKYKRFLDSYIASYNKVPSDEEIIKSIGITEETLKIFRIFSDDTVSLDKAVVNDGKEVGTVSDFIADDKFIAPERYVLDTERKAIVSVLLDYVNDRERRIVELYLGLNGECMTFEAIANVIGLSRQRVTTIYRESLDKMSMYLKRINHVGNNKTLDVVVPLDDFDDLEQVVVNKLFIDSGAGTSINCVMNLEELSSFSESERLNFIKSVIKKYVVSYNKVRGRR